MDEFLSFCPKTSVNDKENGPKKTNVEKEKIHLVYKNLCNFLTNNAIVMSFVI